MIFSPTRRQALALIGASVAALIAKAPLAQTALPGVTVSKDPNCGCCNGWVEHLRQAGFTVTANDTQDLTAIKNSAGVPKTLASCHTARVDNYVIEGHVPADAIKRLLRERPAATGLAVPGMPIGSPGMEGGTPERYEVVLFGKDGQSVFARYQGASAL